MATYKVPQDVEADDKLLGPFSFKQFIFLLIAVGLGALAYFLSTIFIPLAIIPMPFALFFLVLALPLRKDQPTETYVAAIISFYLKPRKKIWQSDGIINTIEFDNQTTEKEVLNESLSYQEASERLSFLSNVIDSQGRSITKINKSPLQDTIVSESYQIKDIQDSSNYINQNLSNMLNKSSQLHKQQIINSINQNNSNNQQFQTPQSTFQQPTQQLYQQPTQQPTQQNKPNIQQESLRELSSNNDFSVETLSSEIKRRKHKKELLDQDSSNISLRK